MPESLATKSQFGNEWIKFGKSPGGKTDDLVELSVLNPVGVRVVRGVSIGASYYNEYLNVYGQNPSFLASKEVPPSLRRVNEQIIPLLSKEEPIVVRSSAIGEHSGTGLYTSSFVLPGSDTASTLANLEAAEKSVYASLINPPKLQESMGMGLLIQPVVGSLHAQYFTPALAGVCTFQNGRPLMRIVIGLGSKAVEAEEAVVVDEGSVTPEILYKSLKHLQRMDVLDRATSAIACNLRIPSEFQEEALTQIPKVMQLHQVWQDLNVKGSPLYWEFVIDPEQLLPCIVQSSSETLSASLPQELETPEGLILFEGSDILNHGKRRGRGIFLLGDDYDLLALKEWNLRNQDYALVIDESVFRRGSNKLRPLSYEHFSNAAVVIERQRSKYRSYSTGGSHFAEVCKQRGILFIGLPDPQKQLQLAQVIGTPTLTIGRFSSYWDVPFKAMNSASKGRVEVLSVGHINELLTNAATATSSEGTKEPGTVAKTTDSQTEFLAELEKMSEALHNMGYDLLYAPGTGMTKEIRDSFIDVAWSIHLAGEYCKRGDGDIRGYISNLSREQAEVLMKHVRNVLSIPDEADTLLNRESYIPLHEYDPMGWEVEYLVEDLFELCQERLDGDNKT